MTMNEASEYPIREAFREFYPQYLEEHPNLSEEKRKAAECIMNCKTGDLGYTVSVCKDCGHLQIHSVSCNNRSCPCCQSVKEKQWEMERNSEVIEGIAYYHVVFTMPHELNDLIRRNLTLLLNLLFLCVRETLLTLCEDSRYMGAKPGILSVLHTWGQKLNFHPHVHTCISGGGITRDGRFVETQHKGFFIPEKVIAKMFRGKYLCGLKKLYEQGKLNLAGMEHLENPQEWKCFINSLFEKRWLPFVKETFNGRGNAVKYLARYSYRTAIANSRILSVGKETVTFKYKDYADSNKEKTLTVKGTTFIGMFLQHILPSRFHRIRFSGYLTNCQKGKNLKLIHKLRNSVYEGNPYRSMKIVQLIKTIYGKDICHCPECSGVMIRYARGTPADKLPSLLNCLDSAMC